VVVVAAGVDVVVVVEVAMIRVVVLHVVVAPFVAGVVDVVDAVARRCPILLRQTSFKAISERIRFKHTGSVSGHRARFGEIESRGVALTPKGGWGQSGQVTLVLEGGMGRYG
jgi:hypothetical protein